MKMKRIILAAAGHFSTQFDYDEVIKFNMTPLSIFLVLFCMYSANYFNKMTML